jgi:hypothetical protein
MDLAKFLNERLDEDAAGAAGCMNCGLPVRRAITKTGFTHGDRGAVGGGWQGVRCPGKLTGALPWPDPARLLREVEAKRKILTEHKLRTEYEVTRPDNPYDVFCEVCGWAADVKGSACPTLRALAAIYEDHPDYDPAWKERDG